MPDPSTEHEGRAEAKHSPLPWRQCGADRGGCVCGLIWAADHETVVAEAWSRCEEGGVTYPRGLAQANATLIVRAVNNHDTLRTALVEAVDKGFDYAAALESVRDAVVEGDDPERAADLIRNVAAALRAKAEAWRKVLEGVGT